MKDLVEFLRARLDGDQYRARAVHNFACDSWPEFKPGRCNCDEPRRLLAEVEAKRRMLEFCVGVLAKFEGADVWGGWPDIAAKHIAEDVLALLVLPYADHPDYDPAWAPPSG